MKPSPCKAMLSRAIFCTTIRETEEKRGDSEAWPTLLVIVYTVTMVARVKKGT
jgi:hypothetical protein